MIAATTTDPARPAGIDGSALPGPYGVGSYAAKLRSHLQERPRVQLFGELWNLRVSRAKVYFELRDVHGALPCSMWHGAWQRAVDVTQLEVHLGAADAQVPQLPEQLHAGARLEVAAELRGVAADAVGAPAMHCRRCRQAAPRRLRWRSWSPRCAIAPARRARVVVVVVVGDEESPVSGLGARERHPV